MRFQGRKGKDPLRPDGLRQMTREFLRENPMTLAAIDRKMKKAKAKQDASR